MEKILMPRPFGATGREVSAFGLGTVKFGRNTGVKYPSGFDLPTDEEISSLIDLCRDRGINLLDTAPAYGTSEERLGQILGKRRDDFFIVTKTGEEFNGEESLYDFSAENTRLSVERSLRRLKTDRLDCVLVHCDRNDLDILKETLVFQTLARLKKEGKVLSYGASTYTVEGGKWAVDHSDAVMVYYNKEHEQEAEVIAHAQAKNRAVLVKKGLASGHVGALGDLAENIRFILETPGVTSLVFGSLSPVNILANIKAAQ